MARPIGFPRQSPPVITLLSRLSLAPVRSISTSTFASGTSPWSDAANTLLAFPFVLEAQTTIYKGFAVTGAGTISNNFEIGILDADYNKLVSSGSVSAGSTVNIPVMADITDTILPPGQYYAGMSCSVTTTGQWFRLAGVNNFAWQALGCWKQASAGPGSFPSPTATPADLTNVAFPLFGLITRSVFDV